MIDETRCVRDFEYYASNLLWIRTKDRQTVRFGRWFPSQVLIWRSIKEDLVKGRPIRKIVLKPRQCGASTLTEAILFWQVHTRPNTHALVLSQDKDSSSYIFEMSRNFYESLPAEIRPLKRYSSKKELVFENPDEKTRPQNPGLRSRIEVQTAGKYTPPRGANFNLVHFSEVAMWPNAAELVPAIIPMVPDLPESMIVYESTAKGIDNFFCDEWKAARAGESIFDPIFFPWTIMPEYSLPFLSKAEQRAFVAELDDEEKELQKKHKVTLEQLKWRRWKIKGLSGDLNNFYQEYPLDEHQAFVFSGDPIFDRKVLEKLKTRKPEGIYSIDTVEEKLYPDKRGLLKVWEHPVEDGDYVIGVDTSSGTSHDFSCMCVLKRTWPEGLAEQVAEWHGKVDPVLLGRLSTILGKYYNNAMLSIEINNHGLTTQNEAQRHYWNFYRWQYFDRVGRTYTQKVGWETNRGTKHLLVDRGRACLRQGLVGVSSEALLQEMFQFTKRADSSEFEAESGNDDRVLAFLIGLFTLYIDDPEASYVLGTEKPLLDMGVRIAPPTTSGIPGLAPVWDATDPRSGAVQPILDWRNL